MELTDAVMKDRKVLLRRLALFSLPLLSHSAELRALSRCFQIEFMRAAGSPGCTWGEKKQQRKLRSAQPVSEVKKKKSRVDT